MVQKIQAPITKYIFSTIYICLIYYGILFAVPSYSATEYSSKTSFCPINITYTEFSEILKEIRHFTSNANVNFKNSKATEYVTLGDPDIRIRIEDELNESSFNQGPEIAYDVFYNYSYYDAPISSIELRLTDNIRDLSISGSDKTQVNALASLIEDEFKDIGCAFGGISYRLILYIALIITALVLYIYSTIKFSISDRVSWLLYVVCSIFIMIMFNVLPWELWFPGTAVRAGPVSFIDRHPELLALLSIIIPFLWPIVQYLKKILSLKKP